ncbi:MAG: hypothetical protein EA381_14750 [Planctomycetaceae bacterium]|nr:MAG: hypothetical protein EA381_14750 [Planctomycetaceae bacterium]
MNMISHFHLLAAVVLLILPACNRNSDVNRKDGVRDALDARSYEAERDAAEDAGDAVMDAGENVGDALREGGRNVRDAFNGS